MRDESKPLLKGSFKVYVCPKLSSTDMESLFCETLRDRHRKKAKRL